MEKNFEYQVTDKEIVIKRKFQSSLDKVWNAFTDSSVLDQWWAPLPWKCITKEQQFTVNGRWLYCMEGPNKEQHWSYMIYKEIKPKEYYMGIDGFCDENGNPISEQPSSEWKVQFDSTENNCTVTSSCKFEKEETLKAYLDMGFLEGYEMGLNNLENLLKK